MLSLPQSVYGYTIGRQLKPGKLTYEVTQGGTSYVMKMLSNRLETTENMITLLKSVGNSRSKFILQWLATSENLSYGEYTCLVFERCTHSFEQLKGNLPVDFNKLNGITQVCLGLAHLHEHGVIHGNLKPSNILFCQAGRDWKVKIADFLVCNIVKHGDSFVSEMKRPDTWYRAPETWPVHGNQVLYRSTADTWSLGCFAYELYKGRSYVNDDTRSVQMPPEGNSVQMPPEWNSLTEKDLYACLRTKKVELESIDNEKEWTKDDGSSYLPLIYGQGQELVRVIHGWDSARLNRLICEFGLQRNDGQNWTIQKVLGLVVTKVIRNMLRADPVTRPNCHQLLLHWSEFKDLEKLVTDCHPEMKPTNRQSSVLSTFPDSPTSELQVIPASEESITKWKCMVKGEEGELKFEYLHINDGSCLDFSLTRRKRQDPMKGKCKDADASDAVAVTNHHNTPADDLRVWVKFSNIPEAGSIYLIKLTLHLQCIPATQEDGNANNSKEICKEATRVLQLNASETKNVLVYFHPRCVKLLANDLPRLTVSTTAIK